MKNLMLNSLTKYLQPYKLNIYLALLYRLIAMMIIMQICRFLFYLFNLSLFPSSTFYSFLTLLPGGVVFDLTAILYVNSLYILLQIIPFRFTSKQIYQKICKYLFIVTNSIAVMANMVDVIYFRFTLRRSSSHIFKEFANEDNQLALLYHFLIDYWFMFIITGILILAIITLYNRVIATSIKIKSNIVYFPVAISIMAISIALLIGGVRGGFSKSTRPITISNATQYINHLGEENIVLNTPFSMIRTISSKIILCVNYFEDDELDSIYSPLHYPKKSGDMDKKNVVILIVESLGSEYIGEYNKSRNIENYEGYTPFLDSLLQHSIYFTESFANGRKSIDAMPAIFNSIPALQYSYILTQYSHNYVKSLPKLLRDEGYSTSFFHGADNGSMGFLAFSKKVEIEKYYGRKEYNDWRRGNDDYDGVWGIWDSKFLEYFSFELDKMKEPFFTSIFTLSSHHPFLLPKGDENKYKSGGLDMHPVTGYTDNALREFFNRAKREKWYNNTLFVITGDHTNQSKYKEYNVSNGRYRVPVILFDPKSENNGARDITASQIDIMPTVINYLNYNKPYFSFGANLLSEESEKFSVYYVNEAYNMHHGDYLLVFNGKDVIALYNIKIDPLQQFDIKDKNIEVKEKMERLLKGFIQQHNMRMIHNNMTI